MATFTNATLDTHPTTAALHTPTLTATLEAS